ncbi:MAG: carotenoid 1,2-hydratase [Anaerolineae bacterium]|nr:carotenoid 1,2-hydratase [Anaerolineae bacterium]
MIRIILAGALVLILVILGFSLIGGAEAPAPAGAVLLNAVGNPAGYARAIEPWDWQFPVDFGAHPEFQTEWWYYTGNLATAEGRRFGFQFTIFRRSITPTVEATESEWRTNQVYMAHFALSDIADQRFFHESRLVRGAADLAGAVLTPNYRVWLEDWGISGLNPEASLTRIQARGGEFALDLTLEQAKPPALHGDAGLSAKSDQVGNASYYYSLSRLLTRGEVRVGEQTYAVTGAAWKDHEFGTSALGEDALGWDWFGLQFDDGRELMVGQIRLLDGGKDPYFGGLLINADGSTRALPADAIAIDAQGSWTSPHTGAIYPAGWTMQIDVGTAAPLVLQVSPLLADQELHGGGIAYWEGAVQIAGGATGYGYAELTGYADSLNGRF